MIVAKKRSGSVPAAEAETTRLSRHYGHQGFVWFIEQAAAIGNRFHAGEWDGSFARAEKVIAQLEQGAAAYSPATAYAYRGLIRVARDDADGGNADAELALELARHARDPQALNPDLANAAYIFTSVGNRRRADETVTEALESLRPLRHLGFGAIESHSLAWAALNLGREAEVVEFLEREAFQSVWLRAALAVRRVTSTRPPRSWPAAASSRTPPSSVCRPAPRRMCAARPISTATSARRGTSAKPRSCWRSTHETSERKVVTVLFADLVSFTARSEQLDPGDVDAMLGPYHERLRYEPERWGGRWRSSSARHLSMIRTSVWG
jgi:hypothetical protein